MKARSTDTSTQQNGDNVAASSASNGHVHDLSILRKPIQTSVTGFHEAMKAYDDGTEEIQKLLANECDIIYECKTCRNIFRSLANFISHKRIYCKNKFNSAHHFDFRRHNGCIDQDISTIIQAEHDHLKKLNQKTVNGAPKNQDKDLGSIIDRLVKREQENRLMKLDDFYDQVSQNLTQAEILERKDQIKSEQPDKQCTVEQKGVLKLDKVASNSSVAVYQTIKPDTDMDDIKTEVDEVHDLMQKENIVLGPDGKVLVDTNDSEFVTLVAKSEYICEICSSKFSTEKTLKLHIKAKHIPSTFVYPCPSCSQTFLQPSAVIRHLNNDHKKSMRRIRLMREAIYRRRTRIDEVPVKGPSRELARLQNDKDRADAQSKLNSNAYNNWLTDSDSISVMTSICAACGKSFERRAALLTHTKTCSQRNSKSTSTTVTSENSPNDDASKFGTAEDSQSSLDDFMRMLNREKQIQAQVENAILVESNRSSPIAVGSSDSTSQSNSTDVDEIKLEPLDDASSSIEFVAKNKRKRNRTRKAELEPLTCAPADDELSYWNMDEEGNLKILKTDPINGDLVLNEPNGDDVENFKLLDEEKDGTTDCTICERQFANLSNLRRHVAMFHYRQKKFGCQFCDVRAYRKIDIVNHLQACHSIGNDNQEAAKLVIVIDIDKNKFSEEKSKAVAHAIVKKRDKEKLENRLKTEQQPVVEPLMTAQQVDENECVAAKTGVPVYETANGCVDFEMAIDVETGVPPQPISKPFTNSPADTETANLVQLNESASFTPPNSVTKDANKFSRNSSNSSLSDDNKPVKRKAKTAPSTTVKVAAGTDKFPRNASNSSLSDEYKPARRPVRKRIKTVNKDFVYDLSNLLKKEAEAYKEQHINMPMSGRSYKRKIQLANIPDDYSATKDVVTATSTTSATALAVPSTLPKVSAISTIKGAANEMAKIAVNNSQACYSQPPQIPTERPIIPAKLIQMRQRSGSAILAKNWPLPAVEPKQISTNGRSSSLDKITGVTKRRRRSAKKTPVSPSFTSSLLAATFATSNLTISQAGTKPNTDFKQILDRNVFQSDNKTKSDSQSANGDAKAHAEPTVVTCPTEEEFDGYMNANHSNETKSLHYIVPASAAASLAYTSNYDSGGIGEAGCKSMVSVDLVNSSSSSAVTPTKRITLLQRLAENRNRKLQQQQNLLKTNFYENGKSSTTAAATSTTTTE